ncbi:radical SAM protein, partial [Streptomyces sp. NPDC006283]
MSSHASEIVKSAPSLAYAANMTTNGYLLDQATATRLVGLGVDSYQVSLDGPKDVHNRTRRRADSGGTFTQIWRNLLALRDSALDFRLTIRVHFSPDTVLLMDPLIEDINREFSEDLRFCVYFKSVERLGGHNDHEIRLFSQRLVDEATQRLNSKLANPRQVPSLEVAGPYVCYASKPNSLVVRATGELTTSCVIGMGPCRGSGWCCDHVCVAGSASVL